MLGALVLSARAASGGGWLHLFVLIAIWDCLKFAVLAFAVLLRGAATTMGKATSRTLAPTVGLYVARPSGHEFAA